MVPTPFGKSILHVYDMPAVLAQSIDSESLGDILCPQYHIIITHLCNFMRGVCKFHAWYMGPWTRGDTNVSKTYKSLKKLS